MKRNIINAAVKETKLQSKSLRVGDEPNNLSISFSHPSGNVLTLLAEASQTLKKSSHKANRPFD